MTVYYTPSFARQYRRLPLVIQRQAEKKENIFRRDPFDQRLRTHKLKGVLRDFWSFSIDHRHRIVFRFADKDEIYFYAVGDHSVYD